MWPRVADFGLAQVVIDHAPDDEQEGLRHRAGTLPYMAPEVLRGQAGGARADQWSFCVSLWESLEDALPFEGWTSRKLLEAIEREQPCAMNPDVPERCGRCCGSAWRASPRSATRTCTRSSPIRSSLRST
ncbi:protein kinase [Enhygromyxa salina]|uniref:protein kinase n=1 Tax=Enhygromyxa salina TaxID=215803 RepID=UPI000D02DAA4